MIGGDPGRASGRAEHRAVLVHALPVHGFQPRPGSTDIADGRHTMGHFRANLSRCSISSTLCSSAHQTVMIGRRTARPTTDALGGVELQTPVSKARAIAFLE